MAFAPDGVAWSARRDNVRQCVYTGRPAWRLGARSARTRNATRNQLYNLVECLTPHSLRAFDSRHAHSLKYGTEPGVLVRVCFGAHPLPCTRCLCRGLRSWEQHPERGLSVPERVVTCRHQLEPSRRDGVCTRWQVAETPSMCHSYRTAERSYGK